MIFTINRYSVGLYQFSMVEAEKELIRTAAEHGDYQYFVLLSGQCYPIKSLDYICNFLEKAIRSRLLRLYRKRMATMSRRISRKYI